MATVDQRVVEMKFDNSQFEAGVKQTITSLDELKTALNLNSATTGINSLQNAFDSIKLDNISSKVDSLADRFSNLGIVGMTAIQNITNKVTDLATSKLSSILGQISSGGWSRASSIAQSRFTLSGLFGDEVYDAVEGTTKVEEAFNNASEAVDGTAYSLSSAVSVASQLAASGVEVGDEMETVLKSISGVAAMTGDTYDSIGNIYTTVAGNGRLMGMQLTQLSTHGLNAAATLADYLGKTEAEVREMVSDGEISFQTFSDAMYDAFGEHAKDANKTFSGSMDNIRAALSRIGAIFASGIIENEEVIDFLNAIRTSINNIKTAIEPLETPFKNLMSSLSNVGITILQTFDTAGLKTFMEYVAVGMDSLSEYLDKFVNIQDTVNNVVDTAKNFYYELYDKSGKAIGEAVKEMTDFNEVMDETNQALADKAWDIWMGSYGDGADRISALGDEYEELQAIVNATSGSIGSYDEFIQACYNHFKTATEATEEFGDATEEVKEPLEQAEGVMSAITTFASGFKRIFSSIVKTLKAVKTAFTNVFSKNGLISDINLFANVFDSLTKAFEVTDERAEKLEIIFEAIFSVVALVKDIFVSLIGTIAKLNPTAGSLYDVLLNIVTAIAKVVLKITTFVRENKIVQGVIETLGNLIFGAASKIKYFFEQFAQLEAVQKIKDKLKEFGDYIGEKFAPIVESAKGVFGDLMDKFKSEDTSGMDALLEGINGALETFIENCEEGWSKVETFTSKFDDLKTKLEEFGITTASLAEAKKVITDFNSAVKDSDSATSFIDNLTEKFGGLSTITESMGNGINTFVSSISDSIGKVLVVGFGAVVISLTMRLSNFVKSLSTLISSIASVPKAVGSSIKMVGQGIKTYFVNKSKAEVIKSFAIAIGVLAVALIALAMVPEENLYRGLGAIEALIVTFGVFIVAITAISKKANVNQLVATKTTLDSIATVILSFAASILILSLALVTLTNNVKWENIKQASITLGVMVGAFAAVTIAMSWLASKAGHINMSALTMVAMAAAIWIIVKALESLTKIQIDDWEDKLIILGSIVAMMAALLLTTYFTKFTGALTILTMIAAIFAIELALKWVITYGVSLEDIISGLSKLGILFSTLFLVAAAIRVASTKTNVSTALTVVAFALVLVVLTKTFMALASVPWYKLIMPMIVMTTMVVMIGILLLALNGQKKNAVGAAVAVLVISIAMYAMIGLMKLLGMLTFEEIYYGMVVMTFLISMISLMIIASNAAKEVKASTIWALTGAMAAVVILMTMMSLIPDKESLLQSAGIIGLGLIALGTSMWLAGQYGDKIKVKSLITMLVAMIIISGLITAIAMVKDPQSILAAGIGLSTLMIAFAVSLGYLADKLSGVKFDKKQLTFMLEFVLLLAAVGVAIGIVVASTYLSDTEKMNVILTGMMAILLELVVLCWWLATNLKGTETTKNRLALLSRMIIMIVAVGAAIALVVTAMRGVSWETAVTAFTSLGLIMGELVVLMKIIAETDSSKLTTKSLILLGVLIVSVVAIAVALSMVARAMSGLDGNQMASTIIGITVVMLAMAAMFYIISTIKNVTPGQLIGMVISIFMLQAIAEALVTLLGTNANWSRMLAAAGAMAAVLLSISISLAILGGIASTGIGMLGLLVAALAISVVLLAIAASVDIFASAIQKVVESIQMLSEINYDDIDTSKLWSLVGIIAAISVVAVVLSVVFGVLSPLILLIALNSLIFAAAISIVLNSASQFVATLTGLVNSVSDFLNLIDSMGDRVDVIRENIEGIGTSMGTGFANMISSFVTTLAENIESLKESVKTIAVAIATGIAETAGVFAATGVIIVFSFVSSFLTTLVEYLPTIVDTLMTAVEVGINALAKAIYEHSDAIVEAVDNLMAVLALKLYQSDAFGWLLDPTGVKSAALQASLNEKFAAMGEEAGESTVEGAQEGVDNGGTIDTSSLINGDTSSWFSFGESSGGSVVDGLQNTISDKLSSFNISDSLGADQLSLDYGVDFSNLSNVDMTEALSGLTTSSDEAMVDLADSNVDTYTSEFEGKISAYEYAKNGFVVNTDDVSEDVADTGEELGGEFGDSYTNGISDYDNTEIIDGIKSWTSSEEAKAEISSAGEEGANDWIQGFINGIYDMSTTLRQAVIDSINGNVVDATAEAEDTGSPSKKAYKFGMWWDAGLANGITDNGYLMADAIKGSFSTLDSDMEEAAAHINSVLNNALDYEPTITPVIDSSNVSAQAGWLDTTLEGQYSMQLAANNQLSIDHANENSLAKQIEDLRTSVQALADKDYSKILDGVNINVDASTNVDGKPLDKRSFNYTVQTMEDQSRSYIRAKGGRV